MPSNGLLKPVKPRSKDKINEPLPSRIGQDGIRRDRCSQAPVSPSP